MFSSKFKRNENLLEAQDSLLLIVDVQEKFHGSVGGYQSVINNAVILAKSAIMLGVPVLYTEQYPKGLGGTVAELAQVAGKEGPFVKLCFSAVWQTELLSRLKELKKRQIIVLGVESHVCIIQTVMDLLANFDGWVYGVSDAVGSRKESDKQAAIWRMQQNGVRIISTEMIVFEWLKEAGTENFKEIRKLVL